MTELNTPLQNTVVRTDLGLFISGTRITIYDVMDYLRADWPPKLIQQWLNLTETQITDVMAYIQNHRAEVETEYTLVLKNTEEIRQYWQARNKEHLSKISNIPPKPGQEHIRAKLAAWKARLQQQ